jgi:hypothetical protein
MGEESSEEEVANEGARSEVSVAELAEDLDDPTAPSHWIH